MQEYFIIIKNLKKTYYAMGKRKERVMLVDSLY